MPRMGLGRYYPGDSPLHRLDARAKIAASFLYIVALFLCQSNWQYAVMLGIFLLLLALARLPLGSVWRGMRLILLLIALACLCHLFLTPGNVIWQGKFLSITDAGLLKAVQMTLRLWLLFGFAALLTLCSSPIEITGALESLLRPFARLGLPAHELAMMVSIALRFLPDLVDKADQINKAQMMRGGGFAVRGLGRKIGNLLPFLIPLFTLSIQTAEDLAEAMEARAYRGGEGRSSFRAARWGAAETCYTVFFFLLLAAWIVIFCMG